MTWARELAKSVNYFNQPLKFYMCLLAPCLFSIVVCCICEITVSLCYHLLFYHQALLATQMPHDCSLCRAYCPTLITYFKSLNVRLISTIKDIVILFNKLYHYLDQAALEK